MADINALVVFYSRLGTAEQLALAAGVGAIEAKASIRLRRLADLADEATIDASPEWRDHHQRMLRDYVTPRPADAEWADVLLVATPRVSAVEVDGYIASLATTLAGKVAAPFSPDAHGEALARLYVSCATSGLIVVPGAIGGQDDVHGAKALGHRAVEVARALKKGTGD